jgi:Ni,Fe-hydrogenase III large subunit
METIAGDTTIGHTTAYAEILETLSGIRVPARAQAFRGIALELERLANHAGDLGALAGDVGFLPTASFCGRVRGDFLNMTALLVGNRFGRGLVRIGGVAYDADDERRTQVLERLERAEQDLMVATELLWDAPSVRARFEDVGILTRKDCLALGIVGPAARASGLIRDARREFPSGIWRVSQIPVSTAQVGDVLARAFVRRLEAQRSITFVREGLQALPEGPLTAEIRPLAGDSMAVAVTEGWRGEIWHVALTDAAGRFARYKVVDPSFHNWMGLAMAMRGEAISDFPLCNKSFNLSYCGFDL